MDILQLKYSLKCTSHPNENVAYLKINHLQRNNNQILYCATCIEDIKTFKIQNFLRIKSIIQSDNQFSLKWPPLDNMKIFEQMKQIKSQIEKQNNLNIEKQINNFFDDLKKQILQKIKNCQNSMLEIASQVKQQNESIMKQLKDFSKIEVLQNILKNTNLDDSEKEKNLRKVIKKTLCEKQQNLQQAIKMINQINEQINYNKFQIPQGIIESILPHFDQINFFKKQINILPNLNLEKQSSIEINNEQNQKNVQIKRMFDHSIEIKCLKDDAKGFFYSDFVLQKEKKYVFRFQVQADSFEDQTFQIGIIDDKIKQENDFYLNQSIFVQQLFERRNRKVSFCGNNLNQKRQGDLCNMKMNVKDETKMIELRVDLQNQIVEILDYPNYNHRQSIDDNVKNTLLENDYRLEINLWGTITARLKSAFICEQFE